ncbi:MAG: hypothetical protein LBN22_11855 [Clostridiales Family XIII bacterium]|jgi:hypothetical protein|nr:hypothetical protein [Clostridiales Family XIII bacterium]
MITLQDLDLFLIEVDEPSEGKSHGEPHYGGDQDWFRHPFYRRAGCGATTTANITNYLASRGQCEGNCYSCLANVDNTRHWSGFLTHMETVVPHVHPGPLGVLTPDFEKGALDYAKKMGASELRTVALYVHTKPRERPSFDETVAFITKYITDDLPVAWVNYSNGGVANLDNYHWVTIVGIDAQQGEVLIVDNAFMHRVNLKEWLRASTLGGAFVALY